MKQSNVTYEIAYTLDLIGGKWKPIILWILLKEGTKRFGELQKYLEAITHKTLTKQLRELEENDLIIRRVFPEVPPRVEYTISDKGKSLEEVLTTMCSWGRRNAPQELSKSLCDGNF